MKHLKLFFALFAMLALGVGNAWGAETDTYDFKTNGVTKVSGPNSGNVTSSSGNVVLKSKTGNTTDTWTIIFTGSTAYGYGKNTGIYFGTNSYAPNAQMTSKSYNYVSQVDIVTTTSNTSYKIGVKVGGSSFGEKTLGSCTSQTQTFTGDVTTGAITISITSSNKKQVKIEKVIITYGSAPATPDPVDPTVTFLNGNYTVGQTLDLSSLWTSNSTGEVTYTVANAGTTGASISGSLFTATAAGTCTVKASQAATSAYNAIEKTATITITAPTPATITLSEAGVETSVSGKNVGDSYTLPTTSSQTCGDKTFVGWSTVEIATPCDKPTSNFYEPGKTVTLSAEQTFYAVYATEGEGGGNVFDGTAGGTFKIYAIVSGQNYYAKGTGQKISSTTNEGEATEYTFTKVSDGVFSIKTSTTYITYASSSNLGTNNTTAYNWKISAGTNGTWRIASVATNTRGIIFRAKTYNQFGGYALSNATEGSTEYFDVEIGGGSAASYSDYTTTCSGSTEPVPSLTQEQFSWSAATATATLPDQFDPKPTLTNTENLDVTYSSSKEDVATIDENGNVTLVGKGETVISATAGDDETYKKTTVSYTLTVKPAPLAPIAGGVIDILNQAWTGVTGTTYTDVAAKTAENEGHSNAQYVAQCAGDKSSIQLRSNNSNSGVVSTVSGGVVKRVEVEWQNETAAGRILQVYGSNTAYEAATDLYSDDKKGEILGEITMGGDETVVDYSQWTGDYKYIGLRSKSGAMYLTTITITWLPINSKVTIDDAIQNGSISVSGAADLNAVAAGTVLTLDNTPDTSYKLAAYDVYKTGEESTKVTVTDGKFIMPEFDVTISATFEAAKTLNSIEITTSATQTTFWQGETFNYDGLKVTAHFDGVADEDVTDKVTVNGSTDTAGTQTVEVSFTEGPTTKTANYDITVKDIPNTKETAYSVADAFDIIDKLGETEGIYITGTISQVDSYSSTYKSITYWISADGTITNQLQVYSGKGLESADFDAVTDLTVGDKVIVCGKLKKYSGTYEFDKNNYLASHTPTTKDPAGLAYTTTSYTANVGEAFTTPELTNPHNLDVTYSTSDASKATVEANTGAVTIVAAGVVTITAATTGDATHDAGSASYTITISNPAMAVATLPFTFNSGKADIENTAGMTQEGLGSDYNATTKLKFDDTDDWVIIHFDREPGQLSYAIKGNSFSGGTFSVQQSADGSTYTEVVTYTELGDAATKEHELAAESRYVKFIYTTKSSGNVGLGDIKITKFGETPVDPEVPEVPEEPTLSAAVYQKVISAPADWSGEYILVYEQEDVTDCYVWNGKDENNGYITATRNNDIISGAFATITIAPMTDGYSVRVNGGDKSGLYIGGVSGSNTISYSAEAILNTIEFSEVGIDLTSNTSVMRFNAASNTLRFRYYKSGQSAVQLYKKLVYTREVTSGNYGTICLPYGSSNYSGAEFFEVAGKETGKVTLNSVKTLVAGTPYIFLATDSKISVVYENEAAEEALVDNGLHGTFKKIDDVKAKSAGKGYIIALMTDGTCALQLCGENCWLDPYRAYLVIEEINKTKSPMPGCRRISMDVQGENIETGVEDIFSTDAPIKVIENGQLIIIRDGIKYNIQGQRL